MSQPGSRPAKRQRGPRRVTAPGTSGQPEEVESQVWDPLVDQTDTQSERSELSFRDEELKREKPPHW